MGIEATGSVFEALRPHGWTTVEVDQDASLQEVAESILGCDVGKVSKASTLVPREQHAATPFSLSSTFGLAAFDAHTDGAAEPCPPRWGLLRLSEGTSTKIPTLLWDMRTLNLPPTHLDVLRRAMWTVRGGSHTFYTSILRRYGEQDMWRYNRVRMQPVGRMGAQAADRLAHTLLLSARIEHRWEPGQVLVFDNWRVLHARPAIGKGEAETRRLERLLVVR